MKMLRRVHRDAALTVYHYSSDGTTKTSGGKGLPLLSAPNLAYKMSPSVVLAPGTVFYWTGEVDTNIAGPDVWNREPGSWPVQVDAAGINACYIKVQLTEYDASIGYKILPQQYYIVRCQDGISQVAAYVPEYGAPLILPSCKPVGNCMFSDEQSAP